VGDAVVVGGAGNAGDTRICSKACTRACRSLTRLRNSCISGTATNVTAGDAGVMGGCGWGLWCGGHLQAKAFQSVLDRGARHPRTPGDLPLGEAGIDELAEVVVGQVGGHGRR
jgi:hypothetical protein